MCKDITRVKPWVRRKDRALWWIYPWMAFNGYNACEFSTWEQAMKWATAQRRY